MSASLEYTLGGLLRARKLTLSSAESCTGGLIADRITNVPGASGYFPGGVVAYAYQAKVSLLGVAWETLRVYGAVSREVVLEMAAGARRAFGVDIAVSVSGIAGPGGGLPGKPVGATWVGLSAPNGDWARYFVWSGDRLHNKAASAQAALQFVIDYLQSEGDFSG